MAFDQHSNFGGSLVVTAPVPPAAGLSLTVTAGTGIRFPTAPFNCTVCPGGVSADFTNAEIIRVTAVVGDTFTIVRAQEGTAAIAIAAGYQVLNVPSVKVFTDIESVIIQAISAGTTNVSASGVSFADANNITFGADGQTITAVAFAEPQVPLWISAMDNSQSTGTVNFDATNADRYRVRFGLDAFGTMTAIINPNNIFPVGAVTLSDDGTNLSISVNPQSTQPVAASASNGSFLFSTLGFSNANNVTFGTSAGSIITASINPSAQSTQPVAASASNGSFLFSTLGFSNGNGVTFGTSAGSIISASVTQSNQNITAGNGGFAFQTLSFSNANSISFSTSAGSAIVASFSYTVPTVTNSSWTVSDSATSGTVARLAFTNLNGVTLSLSTGAGGSHTIVGSHNALTSQSNQNITAGNGGFAFQTLSFSNANNVSFSTSAGSAIVASVTVASTQASIVISAGTTNNQVSNFSFSNGSGVSFGINGSTITASVSTIAAKTISFFEPVPTIGFGTNFFSPSLGVLYFDPIVAPVAFSFTNVQQLASYAMTGASTAVGTSGNAGWTVTNGFYSRSVTDSAATDFSNSNTWLSMWSGSCYTNATWSASLSSITVSYIWQTDSTGGTSTASQSTNSSNLSATQISGPKLFNFPYGTSAPGLQYLFAQMWTTTNGGAAAASNALRVSLQSFSFMTNVSLAPSFAAATNTSTPFLPGLGSVMSAAWPASIATNQLSAKTHRQLARFFM